MAKDPTPTSATGGGSTSSRTGKVAAVVVRASFWTAEDDGSRREVKPGLGEDSVVWVTPNQLANSSGTIVAQADAMAEMARVRTESMQQSTPANAGAVEPGAKKDA